MKIARFTESLGLDDKAERTAADYNYYCRTEGRTSYSLSDMIGMCLYHACEYKSDSQGGQHESCDSDQDRDLW